MRMGENFAVMDACRSSKGCLCIGARRVQNKRGWGGRQ